MTQQGVVPKKKKIEKFREIIAYVFFGFILGLDILIGKLVYEYRQEYFSFAIDWSRSIELGIFVLKVIMLLFILVINLKTLVQVIKKWEDETREEKKEERIGKKEYERLGIIRKGLFFWRVNGARKWMDKYHDEFRKIQRTIGNVRGNETKELEKLKEEAIKGILIWTDDFQITRVEEDKNGNKRNTNIPVTKEFLESLSLSKLYEDYLLKCVNTAERFINGYSEQEKGVEI